jgi:SAM-dependent methyltransferase
VTLPAGTDSLQFDRKYFDTAYRDYTRQNPPWKLRFYRRMLDRHVAGATTPAVLEIGCGLGNFLEGLDERWQKFGFDISRYAVRTAQARTPAAHLAVASGERLPFSRGFDAIVAFDVLEHLRNPEAAFDEVASHLTPSGIFLFVVPVYDGLSGPIIRVLDRDPTHLHKRSRRFWLALARERFEVREWCGLVRYLLPGGLYLNWPTRLLRNHSPAILVVASQIRRSLVSA